MVKTTKSKFTIEAIVLAAALLITLPMRTYQHLSNIQEHTGFYKEFSLDIMIYIAVITFAVMFFIFSAFLKRNQISLEKEPMMLPGCGVLSGVVAITTVWSAIKEYQMLSIDTSKYIVSAQNKAMNIGKPISLIAIAFAALSAVYFGVLAISFLTKKKPDFLKLLSLSPVIWCMLRIIERITRTISYLRVSDLAIEMITITFFILFFMSFAQANSGVNDKGSEWKVAGYGLSAALLALNGFVPKAVLVLTGKSNLMYILAKADPSDIAISLFIIATVLTRIVPKISNVVTEESAEEAAETAEATEATETAENEEA